MAKLAALRHAFGRTAINEVAPPAAVNDGRSTAPMQEMPTKSEADITVNRADESGDASSTLGKELQSQEDMQRGVKDVEAITQTWSKPSLIAAFLLFWLLYFVNAFQSSILSNLTPFVTSEWEEHSLLTVIGIVSNSITAATYIPMAKILDLWGRAEGFAIMTGFATLGLILLATSHSLATYCAAQVFYSVGFGGLIYTIDVITADSTQLKNRGLAYAFTSSPYMIVAFAGSAASEGFYEDISWRWGFGCFAIILPVVASPLFFLLKYNLRKAHAQGLVRQERSERTFVQSVWHYVVEFDALGVFLFASGLTLFLLPFTIADSAPSGWRTGYIIAMVVLGFLLLMLFAIHETFTARTPFLSINLLTNRTVIGACLLDLTYTISYYCWASYFTSFLQVVNNVSIAEAGYISHTFDVVSGLLLLLVGYLIRRFGYFRWLLYWAVPLYILAQGLMIYFRRPGMSVGYQIMCQIFIAMGGSVFIIVEQIAILAASDHQHIAAVLALLNVIGNIGGAVGSTVSGAIWTNTFEKALARYLPASAQDALVDIYNDLDAQLSYEVGSPERLGIQQAYGYAQARMLVAGTVIMSLAFVWMFVIRDLDLKKVRQTKGRVF